MAYLAPVVIYTENNTNWDFSTSDDKGETTYFKLMNPFYEERKSKNLLQNKNKS